ncbi:MAG: DUF3047 domain-containing protein [Myxococcota bacterium]
MVIPPEAPAPTASARPQVVPTLVCDRPISAFETAPLESFPPGWGSRDSDKIEVAQATYLVVEDEGQHVLRGRWRDKTTTIGIQIKDWDLDVYPVLQWRWKAVTLPAGANESNSDTNDTGAAVYAIWKVGFPMFVRGIKYAWSSSLPVGTRTSKRMKYDQMLVLESGEEHLNRWQLAQVDVREHAQAYFETEVGPPDGIAVMTDADSTKTSAEAYFADFKLCRYE